MQRENKILALDVGTTSSGFCKMRGYMPVKFGKINNLDLLELVKSEDYDILVYEGFQSFGMAVSQSVFESVEWNGRYKQAALDRGKKVDKIFRTQEKMNLCGKTSAKDSNIRQALIDRFASYDFKNGKGTKDNPDFFYGFSKDMWSAFAVGTTYLDLEEKK